MERMDERVSKSEKTKKKMEEMRKSLFVDLLIIRRDVSLRY